MAFVSTFFEYIIIMVILAVVAAAGIFAGKKLRDRKDAKNAAASEQTK